MSKFAILCVDDEVTILKSLEMELEEVFGETYLYEFAESGEEALEILEELAHNSIETRLIISDWLMPGIKGDELFAQVQKQYPQIVKVMLTGQADEIVIQQTFQEANLYQCLSKPWQIEKFVTTIQSALAQHESTCDYLCG